MVRRFAFVSDAAVVRREAQSQPPSMSLTGVDVVDAPALEKDQAATAPRLSPSQRLPRTGMRAIVNPSRERLPKFKRSTKAGATMIRRITP